MMSRETGTSELALGIGPETDPDLAALPTPRRGLKRLTLAVMGVTLVASLGLAASLWGDARYALGSGPPRDLGDLGAPGASAALASGWIRAEGLLASAPAIRYARPLVESDTFRLAPIAGNDQVWVEIRVPADLEGPRFVPPTSFVGRLVPFADAGLRHRGLRAAMRETTSTSIPGHAWLLVDGEGPPDSRWALGVVALLVAIAGFNGWGLLRLSRRPVDA